MRVVTSKSTYEVDVEKKLIRRVYEEGQHTDRMARKMAKDGQGWVPFHTVWTGINSPLSAKSVGYYMYIEWPEGQNTRTGTVLKVTEDAVGPSVQS